MQVPSIEEQREIKADADEIRKSIVQKRDSFAEITSINVQRFIVDEEASLFLYSVIACLLFLFKYIEQNHINILLIILGFVGTLIIFFIFGLNIILLRQKQEKEEAKEKHIMPLLLLSFLSYAFGLYLILVVGVYNLIIYFSYIYIPQAIIYIYLGYLIMKRTKILQELGLRISENKDR